MKGSQVLLGLFCLICVHLAVQQNINVDFSKLGRTFEGIGGLSGGGATSRLLVDYQEPYLSQILDYLFVPNFGASLQILKVEIGGDGQTTDGTEPSHMHNRNDLNYERGYEWSLMVAAKKRNPQILLYGLSWCAPGWIGNGNYFSQDNINYHISWLQGAKKQYNLTIDFIGIWNERSWNNDWIKQLRSSLDSNGFSSTKIVAADGGWGIVEDMARDRQLNNSIYAVGVHYPGTTSPSNAQNLGKPLWASEDYSTYADTTGGGCWARILNQNYVNGLMTATISWNLIASYYNSLPFGGDGLMWAEYPWTGNYELKSPVWVSAHTTQFTQIGWRYLEVGSGSGHLPKGGSYVTITNNNDFTMIVETMSHDRSVCIRPPLPPYSISNQTATFQLRNWRGTVPRSLYYWKTHLGSNEESSTYFIKQESVSVNTDGSFTVTLDVDSIYTFTTISTGKKGSYAAPPAPKSFTSILPYSDNFDRYREYSEAAYFADQTGSWEIHDTKDPAHNKVMRQTVTQPVIAWCGASSSPISLIGTRDLTDFNVTVEALIEQGFSGGHVVIGGRTGYGGCTDSYATGYYLTVPENGQWSLTRGGSNVMASGSVGAVGLGKWFKISLQALSDATGAVVLTGEYNNKLLFTERQAKETWSQGWASIGSSYSNVQFDNFYLSIPK